MAAERASSAATCAHCRQRAPIVLRVTEARCAVCGGLRTPFFAATVLNLAGKPATVGAHVARGAGCAVATLGSSLAAVIGILAFAVARVGEALGLWAAGGLGALGLALAFAVPAWAAGLGLYLGGRALARRAQERRRAAELETIHALAKHKGGAITADEAARALSIPLAEADAWLTQLVREPNENVSVELDDEGVIRYGFGGERLEARWRILEERARIAPEAEQVARWNEEAAAHARRDVDGRR